MEFQKSHRQRLAAANEKKVMPLLYLLISSSCLTKLPIAIIIMYVAIISQHVDDFDANGDP